MSIYNITAKKKGQANELTQARKNSLADFGSIEHRLELVDTLEGVDFINDSKATDVNSTWYSLYYMNQPVVWILGTNDQDTDYSLFSEIANEKVKVIICLGAENIGIRRALASDVDFIIEASTLEEAADLAKRNSKEGDVVLFSPACSSFDLFQDYKDRGELFRQEVARLKG